jgi:N-acetylmuramoyl-L-alanine amidase
MTRFYIFILACILTGCCPRGIPPEITALHQLPSPPPKKEKKEIIIVDAGHGGKDAGANNKREKYEEKALTLETAFLISEQLKKLGYRTILTRNEDVFVPLETRAEIANSIDADLFVSIHYNFSSSQEAEGVEVYYYKEDKKPTPLRIIQSKELGMEVLKKVIVQTGAESRGVKQANFAVVRETKMPAILIEAGFLSIFASTLQRNCTGGRPVLSNPPQALGFLTFTLSFAFDSFLVGFLFLCLGFDQIHRANDSIF